ncbi:transposable element Tcb2 transposase [Trichonephila clavipes]|nr:transposable element Tcb2 transposase [Trichonephila clavipes]
MDDNCRPHRANLVEDFLFEEGIVRMEWPVCSPNMNPIEHVWDALGRRVAGRQPPPQTFQELERALLEEWDRIPQLVINSHIDSMPLRCRWVEKSCPSFWPQRTQKDMLMKKRLNPSQVVSASSVDDYSQKAPSHKQNIYGRAAIPKSFLTDVNAKRRLQWCHTYKDWSTDKRKKAIWAEE